MLLFNARPYRDWGSETGSGEIIGSGVVGDGVNNTVGDRDDDCTIVGVSCGQITNLSSGENREATIPTAVNAINIFCWFLSFTTRPMKSRKIVITITTLLIVTVHHSQHVIIDKAATQNIRETLYCISLGAIAHSVLG